MTDVIPPSSAWESSKEVVESESECELEAHDGVTTIVSDDDAGSLRVLLQSPSPSCALDGDDIVAELVGDLVEESMIRSVETFYQQRLTGFASRWIADSMLEVVLSTLGVPSAACERDGASHPANDPILSVLYPPPSALYEPQRSRIDLCCRHEIPLKPPERKPSHETMMSPPNHSIYNKRLHRGPASNCGGRKDSSSRASSHSPLRVQKATIPPESSVASSSSSAVSTLDSKDLGNGEYHAPGVVYSTAPPPRVSPRKAMALLKTAQHMSGVGAAPPSPLIYPPKESDDEATGDVSSEVKQPDGADALSDASCSLSPHAKQSIHPRRRLRGAVGDAMSKGDPFVEEITPIEVEFVVKRSSSGDKRDRRSNGSLLQLPELSPHKQRRRPRQTTFVAGDDSEHSLHQHRDGVITVGDGSASTDDSRFSGDDNDRCCGDLWSSQSHIESMVLAPGVKLQAGVETKAGPALPFVPTRMRKATFYVSGVHGLWKMLSGWLLTFALCGKPAARRCVDAGCFHAVPALFAVPFQQKCTRFESPAAVSCSG